MNINDLKKKLSIKSRIIGLDMGSKRIGVSISDENRKIAVPCKTIKFENINQLIKEIDKIIVESEIVAVIYGNPIKMDGSLGPSSQSVRDRINLISNKIHIPFVPWDERLSTVGSFNISSQLDININKRLEKIDENAATFILQGVLDYLNN